MARPKARGPDPPPPPPPTPLRGSAFEKDVKRLRKGGKDLGKLRAVIDRLCARRPLDSRHRDHALTGDWKGWRDCHIEPDWLLIYKVEGGGLALGRTGSHSELFGK